MYLSQTALILIFLVVYTLGLYHGFKWEKRHRFQLSRRLHLDREDISLERDFALDQGG